MGGNPNYLLSGMILQVLSLLNVFLWSILGVKYCVWLIPGHLYVNFYVLRFPCVSGEPRHADVYFIHPKFP